RKARRDQQPQICRARIDVEIVGRVDAYGRRDRLRTVGKGERWAVRMCVHAFSSMAVRDRATKHQAVRNPLGALCAAAGGRCATRPRPNLPGQRLSRNKTTPAWIAMIATELH